jgi:hypothetical protein
MQPQRNKSEKKNQNEKNQWTKKIREREGENIVNVTTQPNLLYIVRFGPYRPHGFVPGDASPSLSLTPQNGYDKSATNTLNKVSYHSLTRRYEILQSTPLKEPDDPVGTTG